MPIWVLGKLKVINRSVGGLLVSFNYAFPAKHLNFLWICADAAPHCVFVLYKGSSGGSISRQCASLSDRSPLNPAPAMALTWKRHLGSSSSVLILMGFSVNNKKSCLCKVNSQPSRREENVLPREGCQVHVVFLKPSSSTNIFLYSDAVGFCEKWFSVTWVSS